ncbi:MAG: Gldg family protein [Planctomycetota bacterium]|jgi:ABC-type uncharacterized transport system involved in gliding motility auxiliary subunit
MNRLTRSILAIFFVMVIAVSGIWLSENLLKTVRKDLTEQNLYTLSDGSKEIIAGLKQPITMKLFYTKTAAVNSSNDQIRYYNNYYTFVRALLEEYQINSGGNIKLEVIDPRPYTEEELAAVRYGLRRIPMSEEENFIFGLVVQTQFGVTKVIDFFMPDRQQLVEYDISYLIDTAITRQKRRLGVLSSLDLIGDTPYMAQMKRMQNQQPKKKWAIIGELEKKYDVVTVPANTQEINDVDILLVIHPKDFPETTLFAIDQFILKGGRAIVAVDPYCVSDMPDTQQRMQGGQHSAKSNLAKLLSTWGLVMPANTFAGDLMLTHAEATRPGQHPELILPLLELKSAHGCFNADQPMTAQLNSVQMFFSGVLKVKETISDDDPAAGLTHTPLLTTSEKGNSWRAEEYELMMPDYGEFVRRFRTGQEPVTVATMVSGTFKTAFPEGIQVPDESADALAEGGEAKEAIKTVTGLTESVEPCTVVVLADVDMLSNLVAFNPQALQMGLSMPVGDNSSLVSNAIEDLSGSSQLISIRSRGNYRRPFTVVDKIEAKANAETAEEEARIMDQIKGFEKDLNLKLQAIEGENAGKLIGQTIIEEKKNIELELRKMEKELLDVKNRKRVKVEALKSKMRNFCTLLGPGIMLVVAILLGIYRTTKRRRYISHAGDA